MRLPLIAPYGRRFARWSRRSDHLRDHATPATMARSTPLSGARNVIRTGQTLLLLAALVPGRTRHPPGWDDAWTARRAEAIEQTEFDALIASRRGEWQKNYIRKRMAGNFGKKIGDLTLPGAGGRRDRSSAPHRPRQSSGRQRFSGTLDQIGPTAAAQPVTGARPPLR
jgi:hypothetical protein